MNTLDEQQKKIRFVDTTLRDGQQSLIATRMTMEEMRPILTDMDNAGFHAVEVWGGATFDATMRYLKEDPWERLRTLRAAFTKTKLQMLFRGQNMLGYKCYPDDIVEAFIQKASDNGIDIFRMFDALNDLRNLESSVRAVKKAKKHAQLCISYTLSDIHTEDYYRDLIKRLVDMGADSICIKDMAGLLLPGAAYSLVKDIKAICKLPIQLHSHYTSGLASMTYMKAAEAGVDIIDTSMSPFAMGTSQPATEVLNAALESLGYETSLDKDALLRAGAYLKPMRDAAIESGLLSPKVLSADLSTLVYQVPGGMLSNLVSQMKAQNAEDKYEEVLQEIPRVRADLGYPPLVTPSSQIVGTQAVMNVLLGERYKVVPNETKDFVRGMYGQTPGPISDEIRKKIIGDEQISDIAPSKLLKPGLKDAAIKVKPYKEQEEDVLSYALFPQVAEEFFQFRQAQKYGLDPKLADKENQVYPI